MRLVLAADVQAVVAANYIRNLREETIKGLYGRLKQGIYPLPAPLGYLDQGRAKPKAVDPVRGPLIREAFRLYATRNYSQYSLMLEMARRGLRTKSGEIVSKNTIAGILTNPFYYGLIRIRKSNRDFAGVHEPIIARELFEEVQDILHGRAVRPAKKQRQFLYSRLVACGRCGRSLIAEAKKGHTYYRCHARTCIGTSLREEVIDAAFAERFEHLELKPQELAELDSYLANHRAKALDLGQGRIRNLELKIAAIQDRLNRTTDALLDGHIEGETFEARKKALLSERLDCEAEMRLLQENPGAHMKRLDEYVELLKTAPLLFKNGNIEEKREMLQLSLSNRAVYGKTPDFRLVPELSAIAQRCSDQSGEPPSLRDRTFWEGWVDSQVPKNASGAKAA